jgi:hypothetical protein
MGRYSRFPSLFIGVGGWMMFTVPMDTVRAGEASSASLNFDRRRLVAFLHKIRFTIRSIMDDAVNEL